MASPPDIISRTKCVRFTSQFAVKGKSTSKALLFQLIDAGPAPDRLRPWSIISVRLASVTKDEHHPFSSMMMPATATA